MVAFVVVLSTQMYNTGTKMRFSKRIIKSNAQSKWLDLVLDVKFMTLTLLNLIFFILLYSLNIEVVITYICGKSSIQCNFILFETKF